MNAIGRSAPKLARSASGSPCERAARSHATIRPATRKGNTASAGTPCVMPRRNESANVDPRTYESTSMSGALAATISVAVARGVRLPTPERASAAPTRVCVRLSTEPAASGEDAAVAAGDQRRDVREDARELEPAGIRQV